MKTALEPWVCAVTSATKCAPSVHTGTDRTEYWVHYLLSTSRVGIIITIIIIIIIDIIICTSACHLLATLQQIASCSVATQ